jgi:hypothetical protein
MMIFAFMSVANPDRTPGESVAMILGKGRRGRQNFLGDVTRQVEAHISAPLKRLKVCGPAGTPS